MSLAHAWADLRQAGVSLEEVVRRIVAPPPRMVATAPAVPETTLQGGAVPPVLPNAPTASVSLYQAANVLVAASGNLFTYLLPPSTFTAVAQIVRVTYSGLFQGGGPQNVSWTVSCGGVVVVTGTAVGVGTLAFVVACTFSLQTLGAAGSLMGGGVDWRGAVSETIRTGSTPFDSTAAQLVTGTVTMTGGTCLLDSAEIEFLTV